MTSMYSINELNNSGKYILLSNSYEFRNLCSMCNNRCVLDSNISQINCAYKFTYGFILNYTLQVFRTNIVKDSITVSQISDYCDKYCRCNVGDICLYEFDNSNKSQCIVEIVRCLNDDSAVVRIKCVLTDDSGNGILQYLQQTQDTMTVSVKYLKLITHTKM